MMHHCRIGFWLCLSFAFELAVAQPIFASPYSDGLALYNQGRFQPAVVKFEDAVRSNPEDSNAQYYRALNYQRLGDTNKARAGYQAIMQKFPGSQAAQYAGQVLGTSRPAASRQSTNSRNQVESESDADAMLPPYMRPPKDLAQLPDGATIYYKQPGDWMLVDAEINGRQLPVVFDTGATVCVIGKNTLRELNLNPPEGPPTGVGGGFGSGRQVPVWSIKADVKFGTILRRNFPLQVYEHLDTPLIGQVFVRDYDLTVDAGSKTIRLTKKATNRTARQTLGSYAVPFRMEGPKITVMAEVNGKPYPVWFDTGNSGGIIMHALDAKQLNLNVPDDAEMSTAVGAAGATRIIQFPVNRLKLGPIERNNFVISVDLDSEPGGRPCIGQQFLSGWQYTIDNYSKTIQFVRR